MDNVREWIRTHLNISCVVTRQEITELDFTDDRLELVLEKLSFTISWRKIEIGLGRHLVRVYDLGDENTIRLDSTTERVYHDPEEHLLFKVGKTEQSLSFPKTWIQVVSATG